MTRRLSGAGVRRGLRGAGAITTGARLLKEDGGRLLTEAGRGLRFEYHGRIVQEDGRLLLTETGYTIRLE